MQRWQQVDRGIGRYLSASQIWREEGGLECDKHHAELYIQKCTLMGPPFTFFNTFTERFDFLYVRKEMESSFTRSWEIFQQGIVQGDHRGQSRAAGGIEVGPKGIEAGEKGIEALEDGGAKGNEEGAGSLPIIGGGAADGGVFVWEKRKRKSSKQKQHEHQIF